MADFIHPSFAKGEIAPILYGRVDTAMYQVGLRKARNCIIHHTGGVSNRAGTLHIAPVKDHSVGTTRLFDFQFNTEDQHELIFGDQYMWVIRNDALVTNDAIAITDITQANPAVVTTGASHNLSSGSEVIITGVVGMTEVNGKQFKVTVTGATTFELQDQVDDANVDSTGFGAYTSGGEMAEVFELTTPYAAADLAELSLVQSADTITITHKNYAPRDLTRTAINAWSLDVITFEPGIDNPIGQTVTVNTTGTKTVRYKVTAIAEETFEESLSALNNTSETITNITQANPAVVTSTAHGYSDFDDIEIAGVVGMTEVNGRRFRVNVLTADTFELIGEDSTNHTAYASGGTSTQTFVRVTNSGATPDNTISWAAVPGAIRYAVYRNDNGVYGLIGETEVVSVLDLNVTADFTIGPPEARNPFLFAGNFPRTSTYYEQRQAYGGTINQPDTNFFSRTGQRKNLSASSPSQADDAITMTLNARQVNEIRHYYPGDDLLVFTSGAEWRVNSGGNNAFETATLRQKPQGEYGSAFHRPLAFGKTVMFVEENNARIRSMTFALQIDGYQSSDMNLLASHLLADEGPDKFIVTDWAKAQYPEPQLYIVRSDGKMLTMTFDSEQEVVGWTQWDTNGAYEAVSTLKKSVSGVEDGVYVIVRRIVNGRTVRHIERQHTRKFPNLNEAYFVDDGLTFDNNPVNVTAATFGSLTVTVPGHNFSVGDSVYLDGVQWLQDTDNGQEITTTPLNGAIYTVIAVVGDLVTLSLLTTAGSETDFTSDFANDIDDITWNDDGTIGYVFGFQGGAGVEYQVKQYPASTAYDVTTFGASTGTFTLASGSFTPDRWVSRLLWNDTGTKAFTFAMETGPTLAQIEEYDAGTAFDVTSLVLSQSATITGDITFDFTSNAQMFRFNGDGTKIFIIDLGGGTTTKVHEYDLTTAYDLLTISAKIATHDLPADAATGDNGIYVDFEFCANGTKLFWLVSNHSGTPAASPRVDEYTLSTAYDLSTTPAEKDSSFVDEAPLNDDDDGFRSLNYVPAGDKLQFAYSRDRAGTVENLIRQFIFSGSSCILPEVIDTTGLAYFAGGTLSDTADTVSGVDHLEGETICAVADGQVFCNLAVTNGTVTGWGFAAGRIHVGLSYTTDIETLNIVSQGGDASQHKLKNISAVLVRFWKSLDNIFIGPTEDELAQMDVNQLGDGNAAILIGDGENEDREVFINPHWDFHGRIFIRQVDPSPLTILSIIPQYEQEDEQTGAF